MRSRLLISALLVLAASALADEAPRPRAFVLEGAPGVITPPPGPWARETGRPAPGQWFLDLRRESEGIVLRAHVFPVVQAAGPEQVLVQAVDVFFRGLGVDGFGLPTRRALDVWGCPAAEGSMLAVVRGVRVKGRARLVKVSEGDWVLALGYAPARAAPALHDTVHAFVASLEPAEPRFYERRFHTPVLHEVVVVRKPGEAPVTVGHLAAVEALLEAGVGTRFPLGLRSAVRQALREDAQGGPPRARKGFRDCARMLSEALALEPGPRAQAMQTMGRRILDAILARAKEGYAPALRFALAWRELRHLSIGEPQDGLTTGDVAHLVEMSEFLASIAADHEIVADAEARQPLHARLAERWSKLSGEERKALRAAGATWAALRYAWDRASAERRLVFRAAVAVRLTPGEMQERVLAEPPDPRALMTWLKARPQEGLDAALLDAAFDLDDATRHRWIELLQVGDAHGFHLGW